MFSGMMNRVGERQLCRCEPNMGDERVGERRLCRCEPIAGDIRTLAGSFS
jgi:hypothetical protein